MALVRTAFTLVALAAGLSCQIATGQSGDFALTDVRGTATNKRLGGFSKEWFIFRNVDDDASHEYSKAVFTPHDVLLSARIENQAYVAGVVGNGMWAIGLVDMDTGEWVNRLDFSRFVVQEIESGDETFFVLGSMEGRWQAKVYSTDLKELIGEVDIEVDAESGANPSIWWDSENKSWAVTTISPLTTGGVFSFYRESFFISTAFIGEGGQLSARRRWTIRIDRSKIGVSATSRSSIVVIAYPARTVLFDSKNGMVIQEVPVRLSNLHSRESVKWSPASELLYALVSRVDEQYLQQISVKGELIGEIKVPPGETGLLVDDDGVFTVKRKAGPHDGSFHYFANEDFRKN